MGRSTGRNLRQRRRLQQIKKRLVRDDKQARKAKKAARKQLSQPKQPAAA
jgi:hypothetical protein